MPNSELARPGWRNGRAYAQALPCKEVSNKIKEALLGNSESKLHSADPKAELDEYFPALVKDLRLTDFGLASYWFVMLTLCLIFIMAELICVVFYAHNATKLASFQIWLIVCLCGLIVYLMLYGYTYVMEKTRGSLPKLLSGKSVAYIHATPVIWISCFTMILNYCIVRQTGYSASPFLPALLASAVLVFSLPRENNKIVLCLALLSLYLGGRGALITQQMDPKSLQSLIDQWGGQELAKILNVLTFIFSAVSTIWLRQIAGFRLPPQEAKPMATKPPTLRGLTLECMK